MRLAFAVLAFGAALSVAVPLHKRQDSDFGGDSGGDSSDSSDLGNLGSDDASAFTETTPDVVAFNDPEPIDTLVADNTQVPAEVPAEVPAKTPAETTSVDTTVPPAPETPPTSTETIPQVQDTSTGETVTPPTTENVVAENVTPPTPENTPPPAPENVTPPTPENTPPPAPENVTPPTPENVTPPTAENQTPTSEENAPPTPPTTPDGAIALAPNGITSGTLNPPTGDTKTTANNGAGFLDGIDEALTGNPTTTPADDTTKTPPADSKDGSTTQDNKTPTKDDSSILTDEDLNDLDAFLNKDTPTPVTGDNTAKNVIPDAKASASPGDVFSKEQINNVANFVSDFAFTPGKTFDINDLASFFPNTQATQATPLPGSNSGGGGSSSGSRGTSANRPAGYNAGNDLLQKGIALAFNQLAKLLNSAPAQNSPVAQPIRIVTVHPVPVTRQLVSTSRPLVPFVAPINTVVPASRSGTASTASTSGPAASLSSSRSGSILASASISSPVQAPAPPAASTGGS